MKECYPPVGPPAFSRAPSVPPPQGAIEAALVELPAAAARDLFIANLVVEACMRELERHRREHHEAALYAGQLGDIRDLSGGWLARLQARIIARSFARSRAVHT